MNINILLKSSAVLWIVWGLVHILAGIMTMKGVLEGDIASSVIGIADAVDPEILRISYPEAAGAVLGQHGFNLLWIGIVTFISAIYMWKGNIHAIYLAVLVGGLADLGYFLFLDLSGHVKFVPGTLMTLISFSAIILSFIARSKMGKKEYKN